MRTVELLDPNNPEHAEFMFDLGIACRDDLIDDYDTDIILIIHQYQQGIEQGSVKMFLCKEGDEKVGIIWVDLDNKQTGSIHAGLLPKFRQGFTALYFLKRFVEFCFDELDLRLLEAQFPTRNRRAEMLVRRLGFKKYGLRPQGTIQGGKVVSHVLLGMTKEQYLSKKRAS